MNPSRILLSLIVSALTALSAPIATAGAQSVPACAGADTAITPGNTTAARAAMVCLLNNERTARGLVPFAASTPLDQASQAHADDMVARNYKDITAPDPAPQGSTPSARATFFGYPSSAAVYGVWLSSGKTPRSNAIEVIHQGGLCSALVDPIYTDLGVGVASGASGLRISVSFGGQGTPAGSSASCPAAMLATPAAGPKAAAQNLAKQPPSQIAGQLGFPAASTCQSKRAFYIRVKEPKGIKLRGATLYLGTKKSVATRTNGRLRALVDLRGFSKGTFKLKIVAKTTTGVTLTGYRKYKTCAKGGSGHANL